MINCCYPKKISNFSLIYSSHRIVVIVRRVKKNCFFFQGENEGKIIEINLLRYRAISAAVSIDEKILCSFFDRIFFEGERES
jgi:hypothetical protein